MTEFPLNLTTAVSPPKTFTIDGVEYNLLGPDHLSPDQEAEAMALFARHALIQQQLDMTERLAEGEATAKRLRTCRILVLSKLTTIPKALVEKLPLSIQVTLLEAIHEQMARPEEADPDDPAEEDDEPKLDREDVADL